MGIIHPEGWFNASIIMIAKDEEDKGQTMNLAGQLHFFDTEF